VTSSWFFIPRICVYLPSLFPRKLSELDALLGTVRGYFLWQAAWYERGGSVFILNF